MGSRQLVSAATGNLRRDAMSEFRWSMAGAGLTADKLLSMRAVLALPVVARAMVGAANPAVPAYEAVVTAARELGEGIHARILRNGLGIDYAGDAKDLTARRLELIRAHNERARAERTGNLIGETTRALYDVEEKMLGVLVTLLGAPEESLVAEAPRPRRADEPAVPVTTALTVESRDLTCRLDRRTVKKADVVDVWRAVAPDARRLELAYYCDSEIGEPARLVVLEGGRSVAERSYGRRNFRVASVDLPHVVPIGATHRVRYEISYSGRRESEPYFAFHVRTAMSSAVLRVVFDADCLPRHVWRIDALLPGAGAGERDASERIVPDAFGYCDTAFDSLVVGLTYGIGWEW